MILCISDRQPTETLSSLAVRDPHPFSIKGHDKEDHSRWFRMPGGIARH
jgi:hypothetical protein